VDETTRLLPPRGVDGPVDATKHILWKVLAPFCLDGVKKIVDLLHVRGEVEEPDAGIVIVVRIPNNRDADVGFLQKCLVNIVDNVPDLVLGLLDIWSHGVGCVNQE
jgi:hypothetical protein